MNFYRITLIVFFALITTFSNYSQIKTIDVNLNFRNVDNESIISRSMVYVISGQDTLSMGYANEKGKYEFQADIDITSFRDASFEEEGIVSISPNPVSGKLIYVNFKSFNIDEESIKMNIFDASGRYFSPDGFFTPGTYFIRLSALSTNLLWNEKFMISQNGYYSFVLNNLVKSDQSKKSSGNDGIPFLVLAEKAEFLPYKDTVYVQIGTEEYNVHMEPAPKPVPGFTSIGDLTVFNTIVFNADISQAANEEELQFTWNFGDGILSGGEKAAHVFVEPGTYEVILTSVGAYGAKDTISKKIQISAIAEAIDTADITAYVRTNGQIPVEGATISVSGMNVTYLTDVNGRADIRAAVNIPLSIKVSGEGYAVQVQELFLKEGSKFGDHYFNLIPREPAIRISDADYGFNLVNDKGVRVSIPLEGLVDSKGDLVTGDIDVILTDLDVSDKKKILAFPGEFAGISPEGETPMLLSYGVSEFLFEKDGEKLQLSEGKYAEIEIPVYITTHSDGSPVLPGDESPVWSLNEKTGIWVQEGMGIVVQSENSPTQLALHAKVSHFSWWNNDIAPEPYWVIPECKIIDSNGLPTLSIPAGGACYLEGEISGPFGPRNRPNTMNNGRPLPLPPNIDVDLRASGGNGLYSGKKRVNGPAGAVENVVIALSIVYSGGAGDLIEADTLFDASIEDSNDEDSYTFEAVAGKNYIIGVGSAFNSTLTGKVSIFDIDNQHIASGNFADDGFGYTLSSSETGIYTISIKGTSNFPGAYTLSLEEVPNVQLDSNFTFISYFDTQVKKANFYAEKGDIIFPTIFGENSKYSVKLKDPNGRLVLSGGSRALLNLGYYEAQADGFYSIELVSGNSNITRYHIGLAKIEIPYEFPDNEEISVYSDSIGVLGKSFFAKFNGNKGQVINYSLNLNDSLSVYYYLHKPGDEKFYNREVLRNDDLVNFNETVSGNPYAERYALPADGEYILEVRPGRVADLTDLKGKFSLSLFRPEATQISFNQRVEDSIKVPYNFKRYYILLDKPVSLSVLHKSFIKSGYLYTYVYDKNGNQVKNMRTNNFGSAYTYAEMNEIYLDSIIYIESNPTAYNTGLYELEIVDHMNPVSIETNIVPWGEITGEIKKPGDINYFKFSAQSGDYFGLNLLKDQNSTLEGNIRVYKYDAASSLNFTGGSLIQDAWYSSSTANFSGLSSNLTFQIPETGEYMIRVDGISGQFAETKGIGSYALRSSLIKSGDEIIVDSRENYDPLAVTGFVKLALRAVNDGGSVFVRPGDYFEIGNAQIRNRVSLEGADTSLSIINITGTEGFDLQSNGIKISDLNITANKRGFYFRSNVDSILIDKISFSGGSFIDGYSGNDDITIRNSSAITSNSSVIISISGNRALIENNALNVTGGIASGAISVYGDNSAILNNEIGSNLTPSISFNGILVDGDSSLIDSNVLNTYAFGINVTGRTNDRGLYSEISNNTFGSLTGSNGGNSDGIVVGYFDNIQIYNNQFVDYPGLLRGIRLTQSGGKIYNNRITINTGDAIYISNTDSSPEVSVINNTIKKAGISTTYSNIRILNNGGALTPVRILNNIMITPVTTSTAVKAVNSQTTILESDYNLLSGFLSPYSANMSMGINDIEGDPLFIDTDLHIDSTSPARNSGTSLNAPLLDFEGTVRPSGLGVDIGADEYQE